MARDPRTPDCALRGCTKAARRLGLCAEHAKHVPLAVSTQLAIDCLRAQGRLKRAAHREAARIAERAERAARTAARAR